MIESLSNYALTIAFTAFFLNIVGMIVPKGKNGKYVLYVATLIMILTLIYPIFELLNFDLDINKILEENMEEYRVTEMKIEDEITEKQIIEEYKKNVRNGIVGRLEQLGYEVKSVECEYDEITLEPKFLHLEISYDGGEVQPVKIEVSGKSKNVRELSVVEEMKIRQIIEKEYGIRDMEVIMWKD